MNLQKPLIASPPWTVEEQESFARRSSKARQALEIGAQLQRTENAIRHRMTKLGLRVKARKIHAAGEIGLKVNANK